MMWYVGIVSEDNLRYLAARWATMEDIFMVRNLRAHSQDSFLNLGRNDTIHLYPRTAEKRKCFQEKLGKSSVLIGN